MKNAYAKDILRTIQKNSKRFLAIMAITALGLTTFSGITAACRDMYMAADRFYDEQRLFDIRVLSTLGLTEGDVEALGKVSGVETADGAYSETVHTMVGELRQSADMVMLSAAGLNRPYVEAGRLPEAAGEIAVTRKYLDDTGKAIGDSLAIEEELDEDGGEAAEAGEVAPDTGGEGDAKSAGADAADDKDGPATDVDWDTEVEIEEEAEAPTFRSTEYTITGVVIDPMAVANNEGTTAFRSTAVTDYTFFLTPADVDTEVYTAVYLTLEGLAALDGYSDEYEAAVAEAIAVIEAEIMHQREEARYQAVVGEALEKLSDAEATMNEKFAEADEKFTDAWTEIEDAKQELAEGEAELTREEREALQKIADARATLEDGKTQLADAERQLAEGEKTLEATAESTQLLLAQKQAQLDDSLAQLGAGVDGLKAGLGGQWPDGEWDALAAAAAAKTYELSLAATDPNASPDPAEVAAATAQQQADLGTALAAIAAPLGITGEALDTLVGQAVQAGLGLGMAQGGQQALAVQKAAFEEQIAAARKEMAEGKETLAEKWDELNAGEATLNEEEAKARRELAKAWKELAEGRQELAEGEAELVENEVSYHSKKVEAEEKLADAYAELDDIDMTQWYVQDRSSIDSYSSMDSDLSSIGAIGRAFPILFVVVAILISLTTMTRMVEEERGLIGTYKALGFRSAAIGAKYIVYALLASLAGGVLGNLLGFIALPKLLIFILQAIYIVPNVGLSFHAASGLAGTLLFLGSNLAATALACRSELRRTPASLMRPKAPRAGSRILLERLPFVWDRLKFLNKVTARNLFRYKKRLFMTVIGIAGCTALVLAGFAIRDSVTDLMPKQYEHIYRYDLLAVAGDDDGDFEALARHLAGDAAVADSLPARMESVKVLSADGRSESMQMVVVPEGAKLEEYIYTPDTGGTLARLDDEGILITKNAADLLGLAPGATATLQNLTLDRADASVANVVENYLGNNVFISQGLYESLFGEYAPNAVYAHFTGEVTDHAAWADSLLDEDFVMSTASTQAMKESFTTDFAILNYVIYILLVLAAGLAFVVLFTLANTNISERVRELATIKVLGFFDREVHAYANKETLILTAIGVVAGLPLGYAVSGLLLAVLKMPSIQFVLVIEPQSYAIAAVISFSFALIVNLITNRILDRINMVEALKSVE